MHLAGLELTKPTNTRLEDNLIRHRGDRIYTPVWVCSRSMRVENAPHYCWKPTHAVCRQYASRSSINRDHLLLYTIRTTAIVVRVNHVMAQMLATVVNKRQYDWDEVLAVAICRVLLSHSSANNALHIYVDIVLSLRGT